MRALAALLALTLASCGPGGGAGDGGGDALADADRAVEDGGSTDSGADGSADASGDADAGGADECEPAALVAAVSTERIRETAAELTGLGERWTHESQQAAADLLLARLRAAGLAASAEEYVHLGRTYRNVEVVVPGSELREQVFAAGAHFDSTSNDPARAPGADDNAAGAAAVVEIARVLSACTFRRTVRLLLFSNEEVGAVGSAAYAAAAAARGDDIEGFLALDMIAYGGPDEDLEVATRPEHAWLAARVAEASRTLVGLPATEVIDDACG